MLVLLFSSTPHTVRCRLSAEMLKFLLALFACLVYVSAETVVTQTCLGDSEQPKLNEVEMRVTDCHDPELCLLIRNTTHQVRITFVATEDTDGLKMTVYGRVLRVRVPYVRQVPICGNTTSPDGTTCVQENGLKAGKAYTITYPFYIRSQFPEWKVPVEFEIWDDDTKLHCLRVQVEIKCNVDTEANCRREK